MAGPSGEVASWQVEDAAAARNRRHTRASRAVLIIDMPRRTIGGVMGG